MENIENVFEYRDVFADLIETAERDDFQFFCQMNFLISVMFEFFVK